MTLIPGSTLRWDYLYAVTLKTKVFDNHARLEVSWITSTRGLLLRGYTGRSGGRRTNNFAKKNNDNNQILVWTMGLLCPFFHNFVLFSAFDFLFALTLFHVVDVLFVFCCTFVVIYSYGWLLFHCCALIYLFVFSILGVRLILVYE